MAPIVSVIDIARPPREVFRFVTDPARFAEWQADVVRVETPAPGGPLGAGARFVTTRRIGGVDRTLVQEVTESRAPARWAARGVEGPVRPSATITVEPIDDGLGSRVTFGLDFEGHGIGVPLLPLIRRQTRRQAPKSYQNLRRLLESRA